jgi:hypothetical protein
MYLIGALSRALPDLGSPSGLFVNSGVLGWMPGKQDSQSVHNMP